MKLFLDPDVTDKGGAAPAAPAAPAPAAQPAAPAQPAPAAPAAAPAKEPEKAPWLKAPEAPKKDAEPAKAPEKFELKLPEGMAMEAAALEKYGADMRALGFTQDQTQKLLERDFAAQKASNEAIVAELSRQDAEWLGQLRTKYGAKFDERAEKLKRVFDYADPDGKFRKGLEDMRMAHHPLLVDFVDRFIPLIEEDTLKSPGQAGAGAQKDNRPAQERLADHYRQQAAKQRQVQPQGPRR